jgi:hypothetical protein
VKRIFLLSPAQTGGERAKLLFNPRARFSLAQRLQRGECATLGEIFWFLSGLYFRGKLTYAETFANAPLRLPRTLVITSNRGLLPPETPISLEELRAFAGVPIDHRNTRFREPLERDVSLIASLLPARASIILLGSVSTRKYTDILSAAFGKRLLFPTDFVGRGDMSRGGLLLRCVASKQELEYATVAGAVLRGKRPARLRPIDPVLRALYNRFDSRTYHQP